MRIGILTEALKQGGVERTVVNIDKSLIQYEKNIILYDSSEISYDINSRILTLKLPIFPFKSFLQEFLAILTGIIRLRKCKVENDIDICISFKEHPNIINILSGKCLSVISVREYKSAGFKYTGIFGSVIKFFMGYFYNKSDKVVAVSHAIAKDLIKNFNVKHEKIVVLYNGCDCSGIEKLSRDDVPIGVNLSGPIVITIGRLSREKLHWQLIRSFSNVVQIIPEAKLVIVGSGAELGYLKKITTGLQLNDNVQFVGFQENPYKFLRKSDLFVLSSLWEGFPNVILEAMACDLPVISVDCKSGPRELLGPNINVDELIDSITFAEYGVLLPELDGEYKKNNDPLTKQEIMMANSIVQLLSDEKLRKHYKERGRSRVRDFSMDKFADSWRAIIDSFGIQ
ncbi:MAG: glycosyltransferase [Desulfobulbus sp.]|nr:glycosyltransferase [Desulfobulbus sp.]